MRPFSPCFAHFCLCTCLSEEQIKWKSTLRFFKRAPAHPPNFLGSPLMFFVCYVVFYAAFL